MEFMVNNLGNIFCRSKIAEFKAMRHGRLQDKFKFLIKRSIISKLSIKCAIIISNTKITRNTKQLTSKCNMLQ